MSEDRPEEKVIIIREIAGTIGANIVQRHRRGVFGGESDPSRDVVNLKAALEAQIAKALKGALQGVTVQAAAAKKTGPAYRRNLEQHAEEMMR